MQATNASSDTEFSKYSINCSFSTITTLQKNWTILLFLLFSTSFLSVNAQTTSPTNGNIGQDVRPSGWSSTGSTDISNVAGWAGGFLPWIGTVTNPPSGHVTWISGANNEKASTSITGLVIGNSYTLTLYAAEIPSEAASAAGVPPNVNYDGVLGLSDFSTGAILKTYNFTGGASNAWNTFTYPFTATATTLSITFGYSPSSGTNGNFWNISLGSNAVALTCNAGTTAPTLSAVTKANTCPATTVDLTTITASNTPAGATLTWHTGTPATTANKITGTVVAAGAYYAAFFNATNGCYSGTLGAATTAVTATVSNCCPVVSPISN